MQAGTLISVDEYLNTSYSPDCDYVDGRILERNVGERDHSKLQIALGSYFYTRQKQWNIVAYTEQRIQVAPTRFRIPDVCVVLCPEPQDQILREPPFLCIEILSKDDRAAGIEEKVDDYLNFGVKYVWVIDPKTGKALIHTASGIHEAKDGILTTQNPDITISLGEI
jgi:Uma2 family endonuclease